MTTSIGKKLRFRSRQCDRHIGMIPVITGIASFWLLSGIALMEAGIIARHSASTAALVLLFLCTIGFVLLFKCFKWIKEKDEHYVLSLDGDLLSLAAYDELERARSIQQVLLTDVKTADYYELPKSRNLLLHGKKDDVRIPLWSFRSDVAKKIIDYVQSHGVTVVGVTNDFVI